MKLAGKTVFITGGGSGIGFALAEKFLARGATVIICGRDKARLARAKAALDEIHTFPLDISKIEDVRLAVQDIKQTFGCIHLLVNNAAVNGRYAFTNKEAEDIEEIRRQIEINLTSTLTITRLFLPLLQAQNEAAVVNISSALIYAPRRVVPVYSATKAALHSISISLRAQLKDTPVRVFEAIPPTVETDMTRDSCFPKMKAEKCAAVIVRGIERNRYEIRMGLTHLIYFFSRLMPALTSKIVCSYNE